MRVLFTTPILEHPAAGGPQLRIENSIKALVKVCELDIIYRDLGYSDSERREETSAFFRNYAGEYHLISRPEPKGVGPAAKLSSVLERGMNRLFDTRTQVHARYILDHVERRGIDVVWFGYGNISFPLIKLIKAAKPSLKVVCDTDSVWSRFVLRELPYVTGLRKWRVWRDGKRKEAEERAWVNLCEMTTAVSEVDAEYYRSVAFNPERVRVFSNVIDVESYVSHPQPPAGFRTPSIYLAGSFGHYNSPMDTAARWMLEEVFPRVLATHPHVHFYIVGRNSELGFGHIKNDNVTVTGRLESVLPYLCNTDIALVPLMFESGTRFKILEAGACRVPIVSTTLGAEGIPVQNGQHILIADEPEMFAAAIIRLLDDKELAKKLTINCHDLVSRDFSVDALANEARGILEYLS